jgi:hypothetical protein
VYVCVYVYVCMHTRTYRRQIASVSSGLMSSFRGSKSYSCLVVHSLW